MKETRACARCGTSVTRMPSRFVTPPESTYCSVRCRNLAHLAAMDPARAFRFSGHQVYRNKNLPRGVDHPCWKGDAARDTTKRRRAQRQFLVDRCERCGEPACDRHHRDGDTGNNDASNVAILCRRCHMTVDGRLERLADSRYVPSIQPPKPCSICGRLSKPLRRSRCGACYEHVRLHGTERVVRWPRSSCQAAGAPHA